jgi:lipopolysaccharide biosynthesis protein
MNRTVIFAHYDKNNKIENYVIFYLKELKKIAKNIVFVSDCNLNEEEIVKLSNITHHIIAKRHGEYDFGSYKYGYLYAKENNLLNTEELILANDSCFGPLISFENIWNEINKKECDFWGINQNDIDVDFHIQSFFMVFKENVFKNELFDNFITSIKKQENKDEIIKKYEIGLSKLLLGNGFKAQSFCNYPSDRKVTQDLVFNKTAPLIKKWEILELYPKLTKLICQKIIKRLNSAYDIDLIIDYTKKHSNKKLKNNLKIIRRILIDIKLKRKKFCVLGKNLFP